MEKMQAKPASIDEYIAAAPESVRGRLESMRAAIREAAPMASEKISYGMPTFFYKQNLVHFAAFARHIGFYPTPSGVAAFEDEIAEFKNSKGAVQFPLDRPLPIDLVKRIVAFRVDEIDRAKSI